ncbi:MAG: hypothetical protein GY708_15685 [Actinomycetia bacterium]|nr:hypothetical protein [Actinomycetes bacterium]MCP4960704.1 hypothetical protein [Actinomycetes bacterium]
MNTRDAYCRALALAREAEELALIGRLGGKTLDELRVEALDCVLAMAHSYAAEPLTMPLADERS